MRCGEEFYKLSFIFGGFFPDVCVGPPKEGESLSNAKDRMGPPVSAKQAERWSGKVPVNKNIPTCQRNTQYVRLTCVSTITFEAEAKAQPTFCARWAVYSIVPIFLLWYTTGSPVFLGRVL